MSDQKVAFVTGASRGIGRAIALGLAQTGYRIAGTATSEAGAESITAYLQAAGVSGKGYVMDVCDEAAIKAVHQQITDDFSAPLILINNAAITQDNLFLRMKPAQWDAVINTDLNGTFHVTKACMKAMFKARWGRIISITSVVGVAGNPGQANYCAAKAGVIGFTKSIAQEMAAAGVTANAVAPGFIDTDMTQALTEAQQTAILGQIPMKKMGAVEDIANAVVFLASDQAAYITGQTLHINGGMLMV